MVEIHPDELPDVPVRVTLDDGEGLYEGWGDVGVVKNGDTVLTHPPSKHAAHLLADVPAQLRAAQP